MKAKKPTKLESVTIDITSEYAKEATSVMREVTTAETFTISNSLRTLGVIPKIAAPVSAAKGFIVSVSKTRPKSNPMSANRAIRIAIGAIRSPSNGEDGPLIFVSFCVDIVFPSSVLDAAIRL